jgi:hypothetical protein
MAAPVTKIQLLRNLFDAQAIATNIAIGSSAGRMLTAIENSIPAEAMRYGFLLGNSKIATAAKAAA